MLMTVGDVDVYARGYKNSRGLDSPGVNIATTITVCTLRKSKLHAKYSILVNFSIFFSQTNTHKICRDRS